MATPDTLPKSDSVVDVRTLLHYLQEMIWHKFKYYVPDNIIRNPLISSYLITSVYKAKVNSLKQLVESATNGNKNNPTVGIKYKVILDQAQKLVPEVTNDPLQRIRDRLSDSEDLNVTMAIVNGDIHEL